MGVVTPIGETPAEFSASLRAGRSGITRWKHMDERTLSKIGGDMCEFDLGAHFERVGAGYPPDLIKRARTVLRATPLTGRLAGAAALQAYVDAGLHDTGLDPERVGHVAGGNNLNNNYFVQNVRAFDAGPRIHRSPPGNGVLGHRRAWQGRGAVDHQGPQLHGRQCLRERQRGAPLRDRPPARGPRGRRGGLGRHAGAGSGRAAGLGADECARVAVVRRRPDPGQPALRRTAPGLRARRGRRRGHPRDPRRRAGARRADPCRAAGRRVDL